MIFKAYIFGCVSIRALKLLTQLSSLVTEASSQEILVFPFAYASRGG